MRGVLVRYCPSCLRIAARFSSLTMPLSNTQILRVLPYLRSTIRRIVSTVETSYKLPHQSSDDQRERGGSSDRWMQPRSVAGDLRIRSTEPMRYSSTRGGSEGNREALGVKSRYDFGF